MIYMSGVTSYKGLGQYHPAWPQSAALFIQRLENPQGLYCTFRSGHRLTVHTSAHLTPAINYPTDTT